MDLMKLGTELIQSTLGEHFSESDINSALSLLLNSNKDGNIDLTSLISGITEKGGGLENILGSWLGDGDNDTVSGSQIQDMLGNEKIAQFAKKLNINEDSATSSLVDAIPQMIDKASSGGSLLDSIGGVEGAIGIAKKLFG